MSTNRQATTATKTATAAPPAVGRRSVVLLTLALAVSWASMLFHNQELPLTVFAVENTGPLAFDVALLVACWWRPSSRVVWTVTLIWGLLNMVVGGIVTVLPLPFLPFVPPQTIEHYAVHAVYTLGQVPLVLLAAGSLWRLRRHGMERRADGAS